MSSMIQNQQDNKKVCEAIDCNELASDEIKVKVKNNIPLRFQVCHRCKHKFFDDKDSNKALNLFRIILKRYGKINYPHGHADESSLINYVVTFIIESFLLKQQKGYKELFDELINNRNYSEYIKKEIIYTIRQEKFISNSNILDKTIEICLKLFSEGSNKVKEDVEFFFLYNLIQTNTSLYPKIKKLLDEIANIKYSNPILSYSNTYHFTILNYLDKFCNEFPEDAASYLIRILLLNDFLINSMMTSIILKILEKLLIDNTIGSMQRNKLIEILNKINDPRYWEVEEIRRKLK